MRRVWIVLNRIRWLFSSITCTVSWITYRGWWAAAAVRFVCRTSWRNVKFAARIAIAEERRKRATGSAHGEGPLFEKQRPILAVLSQTGSPRLLRRHCRHGAVVGVPALSAGLRPGRGTVQAGPGVRGRSPCLKQIRAEGAACGQGGNAPGCRSPPGVRERARHARSGCGAAVAWLRMITLIVQCHGRVDAEAPGRERFPRDGLADRGRDRAAVSYSACTFRWRRCATRSARRLCRAPRAAAACGPRP
jgi:hypothetical protein